MSNGAIPTPDPNSPAWSIYLDSQPFNLTAIDGTQTTLTLSMINSFATFNQRTVAIQGFALGFSSLLIIVLLLLTTAKKARRAIFIFNFLSLLFLSIRSIFNIAIACTDLYHGIGEAFLGATAQYSRADSAPSVVNALISLFLTITVVTSLVLQVRVVFAAEPQTQKIITTFLSLFALWIVGAYAHYMALYIEVHLNIIDVPIPWTYKAYQISMIVFIGISCLLFLYKLFIAIRLRKRMGYKNFGPLQILFIMFAQCLIIPAIIYILDFEISQIEALGNLAQTFLVVSLPLSTLWASHGSEQAPLPQTSLSSVSENSSRIAQKFRFLRRDKESDEDLEKASSITDTTTTSIKQGKAGFENKETGFSS